MARKILHTEIPASFDGSFIHMEQPIEWVEKIEVTAAFQHGFFQFKGWGWPEALSLNGAMMAGKLFGLHEIDPEDRDLIRDPFAPVLPR